MPEPHAIAAMLLTVIALVLFTRERIPLETSSMAVIAALAIGFELFPYHADGRTLHAVEFFHGFGHEALVAVCALMIAAWAINVAVAERAIRRDRFARPAVGLPRP
jgi:hypothetical protein